MLRKNLAMQGRDKACLVSTHEDGITGRDKACLVSTDRVGKNVHYRWQNPGKGSLSTIIGSFKSACTNEINKKFPHLNFAWQPRFYDHIIKNDKSFFNIQDYIRANPERWERDRNNPSNLWM